MKTQLKCIILGAALFSVCRIGFSQENILRLSLREAQEHALMHNRNVLNAGLSVSEAQKRTWETISAGLPQVSANLSYQNMMGFSMNFAGMNIAMPPTSNLQTTVNQLLFSGSYWVGIRMSKLGEELSETARQQTELDVRHQTQSAYFTYVETWRRVVGNCPSANRVRREASNAVCLFHGFGCAGKYENIGAKP